MRSVLPPARFLGAAAALSFAVLLPRDAFAQAADSSLSFFITGTSLETGGNFGGLSGADAHCQSLAAAVGAGNKVWRAYLSAQAVGNAPAVHARDRIGTGPWFNANKVKVASNVAELHGTNNLNKQTSVTQTGVVINGRGDSPNKHDVVTGSRADGTAPAAGADSTCANWTSNATGLPARAIVGHHDRMGISSNIDPQSWNQAHVTSGCSQTNLEAGGGDGLFYCFALATPTGLRSGTEQRLGALSDRASYMLGGMPRGREVVYRFALDKRARVKVAVHDLEGRERAVLVDATLNAGRHLAEWDGAAASGLPLPAGLYVIALKRDAQVGN